MPSSQTNTTTQRLLSSTLSPSPAMAAAAAGSHLLAAGFSLRRCSGKKLDHAPTPTSSTRRLAVSTEQPIPFGKTTAARYKEDGSSKESGEVNYNNNPYLIEIKKGTRVESGRKTIKEYFEQAKDLIRSDGDGGGGPPRWFSPLECGSRLENAPLLLFLPGIDGVGLGLIKHHHSLGKIFDLWCLHIPVKDRTSFKGLVKLVERTVRAEHWRSPNRPIYLVGESLGACLALGVAACNPDVDLVLILANAATSFARSQLQHIIPVLEATPDLFQFSLPYLLILLMKGSGPSGIGDHLKTAMDNVLQGIPLQQTVEGMSQDLIAMPSYLSVLADILPRETLIWKLKMLKSASAFVNSRLHSVKSQTLILSSGRDQFLASEEEGLRLRHTLLNCENRSFSDSGHFLFMDDDVDLVYTIVGASFYRSGKCHDYILDYIPPTPFEFKKIYESNRLHLLATSPVMLSTLEDGKIVRGLAGIPSEGPVLFIGYHMLLGFELVPMVIKFLLERNILLRGIAHPMMFTRIKEGRLPPLASFDMYRRMGAVPVSGNTMYKLLSSNSHVLLYPGGMREACHRKGEQYKLIWPEQAEFIRMAARFGAKIVPFGVVGEDDFGEVAFDYDDQMKYPFFRDLIEGLSSESDGVRSGLNDEVNQAMHLPGVVPKFPGGRFYYYYGKPIETEGRKHELKNKEKAHEVYLQVKSEVEKCIAFLIDKRENDPYRNLLTRLAYQARHGFDAEIPSFEL